jgi:hypothetical protein
MRKALFYGLFCVVACNTLADLREWYAVTDPTPRQPTPAAQVSVLEAPPSDRQFKVIGIFAPPASAFESFAEAVNGARRIAAQYGADALIITKNEEVALSRVSILEPSSGIVFRAQAIVWK